MSIELCYHMM